MTLRPNRWSRRLGRLALALALTTGAAPAFAQEPAPGEEKVQGTGRVLDGYLVALCLAGMVLFAVAKSARR